LTSVTIPNSVTKIGDEAFSGCSGLKKVTFEDGISALKVGYSLVDKNYTVGQFYDCHLEEVYLGRNLEYNVSPFSDQKNLSSLTIGNSVTSIGGSAFYGCTGLTSITIGESVKTIGGSAFSGCSALTSVTIGESVETIGNCAFMDCSNLELVKSLALIPPSFTNKYDYFSYKNTFSDYAATLEVLPEALNAYKQHDGWRRFKNITTISAPVSEISLNETELTLEVNGSTTLTVTIHPEDASEKPLIWASSDEKIVTVDQNGKVTAISVGEADITVTATDDSGVSAVCHITVLPVLAESITIEPTQWSGYEGESFTISATVLPESTTDPTLSWTSSDQTIATVDNEGVVSVLKPGNCIITASTVDGSSLSADCIITSSSGINAIFNDDSGLWDVYKVSGSLILKDGNYEQLRQLSPGIYILRQGSRSHKLLLK
ncbi:MAG: leucine-rich repeat protein, partial [Muribaculaceae bacterium]|nr:leucine-rich repeat protein [Muribaculaceae bacterium]